MTRLPMLALALAATAAAPLAASAQTTPTRHQVERREARADRESYRNCRSERRSAGNKGTVGGALVGGASGALIGGDLTGGLVGAGVGAVAGHEIAKHRTRC